MGGDFVGGILGGIGNALGQQQQNAMLAQWQNASTTNGTWADSTHNTYVVSTYPVEAVAPQPKGPESALQWLDRRVNEVRLPLAA